METIELWPFSQGEIDGTPDRFIDAAFRQGPDLRHTSVVTRTDYADRVVRGGLPEAVARDEPRRRARFLDAYVQNLIQRDVRQLAEVERVAQLTSLVRLLAARSATLVAPGALESDLRLSRSTVARPPSSPSSIPASPPSCSLRTATVCDAPTARSARCSRVSSSPSWPAS
jgi:predicted AAA+ superfamily ATPase